MRNVTLQAIHPNGTPVPSDEEITVELWPLYRRELNGSILNNRRQVHAFTGSKTVSLETTTPDWVWVARITPKNMDSWTEFFPLLPGEPVQYADMIKTTIIGTSPGEQPEDSWWAYARAAVIDAEKVNGRLVITRADGTVTDLGRVDGLPGPSGDTPTLSVQETLTGAPGTPAEVVRTRSPLTGDYRDTFTIPQGIQGEPALGTEPQQEAIANWVTGDNPLATALNTQTLQSTVTYMRDRAILASDYGELGTSDDSATLNAAIADARGRRVQLPADAVLNVREVHVSNTEHSTLDGNGSTLNLIGTGARTIGVKFSGIVEDVQVSNLKVSGDGALVNSQAGVANSAGAQLKDIRLTGVVMEDLTLGASFSADGSGSLYGLTYEHCTARRIIGTTSGYGYGFHASVSGEQDTNIRMLNNTAESTGRHAYYMAKGRGIFMMGNTSLDHRDLHKASPDVLPALMVARSADVRMIANYVHRPAGGGMYIGGIGSGDHADEYIVMMNELSEAQNNATLVYLGQQDPLTENVPTNVDFSHNMLSNTTPYGLMTVFNGKHLDINRNKFRIKQSAATATALTFRGDGVTGNDWMDDITVTENKFWTPAASQVAMRFSPGHQEDTTWYRFRGNQKFGAGAMFASSAALTNPNIDIQDQSRQGLSMASGTTTQAWALHGPATTLAPATGTAGALPAQPAGWVTVLVNGIERKQPYW